MIRCKAGISDLCERESQGAVLERLEGTLKGFIIGIAMRPAYFTLFVLSFLHILFHACCQLAAPRAGSQLTSSILL